MHAAVEALVALGFLIGLALAAGRWGQDSRPESDYRVRREAIPPWSGPVVGPDREAGAGWSIQIARAGSVAKRAQQDESPGCSRGFGAGSYGGDLPAAGTR